MTKRYLIAGTTVVFLIAVVAVSARAWQRHVARQRIETALAYVKPGMSPVDVERLLGPPTFDETPISSTFSPSRETCKQRSVSAYVYQSPREATLVVFFDAQKRVECLETMTSFRIISLWHKGAADASEPASNRSQSGA